MPASSVAGSSCGGNMSKKRYKFTLVSQKDYKEIIKKKIKQFVEERWLQGKKTTLQDIQNAFQKPYNLSEGTVRNYLNELVNDRKLSTYYKGGRRFYAPPKIPLSIKFGIAMALLIMVCGVLVDTFVPSDYILKYVYLYNPDLNNQVIPQNPSMLPIVMYLLILTAIFTVFAYWIEKKK